MVLIPGLLFISTSLLCVSAARWRNTSSTTDCPPVCPSLMISLQTNPDQVPWNRTSKLSKHRNAANSVHGDTLVQFSLPNNSYGCQLELIFPEGFNSSVTGSGSGQIDFWTADRAIHSQTRWSNASDEATLFGTTALLRGDRRVIVNACECRPTMSFRVRMASNGSEGDASFDQTLRDGLKVSRRC